ERYSTGATGRLDVGKSRGVAAPVRVGRHERLADAPVLPDERAAARGVGVAARGQGLPPGVLLPTTRDAIAIDAAQALEAEREGAHVVGPVGELAGVERQMRLARDLQRAEREAHAGRLRAPVRTR